VNISTPDNPTGFAKPAPVEQNARFKRNPRSHKAGKELQGGLAVNRSNLSHWVGPLLVLLGAGLVWLFLARPAEISLEQSLLGLTIIGLGCIPLFLYLRDVRRPHLPFLPLVGLYYAVSFGLPLFTVHLQEQQEHLAFRVEDVSIASLWLTIGGMVSMFSLYLAGERIVWRGTRHVRIPWDGGSFKLRLVLWGCLTLHWSFNILPGLRSVPSLGQLVGPVGFLGWGMILVLWLTKRLSMIEKYLLAPGALMVELVFRSTTGLLSTTIFFGLFSAVIVFRFRPSMGVMVFVLSLGFLIVLNPVKNEFRKMTWFGGEQSNDSAMQRVRVLVQLAENYYFAPKYGSPSEDHVKVFGVLATRLSMINYLSRVVSMTPSSVPYWRGYTYRSIFTKFIPRFLWPDKPQELTGNEFGQRYGFLDEGDDTTSLNLPWIVELYANFGIWGILLGMGVIGLLLAFLNQLFNQPRMNEVEFIYGMSIMFGLFYQESSFTLMIGGVFLLSIALYVLLKQAYGGGVSHRKKIRRNNQIGVPPLD
jgi:hypothetical protein